VEQGKLSIGRVLSVEKQQAISEEFSSEGDNSWSAVKTRLGDDFSYAEIKMMVAYQNYLDSK
jgi:hypothetical protein